MNTPRRIRDLTVGVLIALSLASVVPCYAAELTGRVTVGGSPVGGATVTLWQAGTGAPQKVGETHSGADGSFAFSDLSAGENVRYIVANGGPQTNGGGNPALALLALLDSKAPEHVIVNEFTTVASAFTAARFIQGEAISGNPLGLRIAAMNVPNFVDLRTGSWGRVIIDPYNSYKGTTLAKFGTLASLVTYAATAASSDWRARFFAASTPDGGAAPSNTLEAMAGIARESFAHPKDLFALFDEAYPQPKEDSRRSTPFAPYLSFAPPDFALLLWFAGGGIEAPGHLEFDAAGNVWIGDNWMPGSQSSYDLNIPGGVSELAPDGTQLSPPITGFTGGGIEGLGWGGAVTLHDMWAPGLNGKILVLDLQGHRVADSSDLPFHEKLGSLNGTGVAANGDVWITNTANDQLLYFPGGRVSAARIVKPAGLSQPFDVVIDDQNRVWVSNTASDTVTRFPVNNPNDEQTFKVGISPRGLALDSRGNVWVANIVSPGTPMPPVPKGVSTMQQFKILLGSLLKKIQAGEIKSTGMVSMIHPDGTQPAPAGFNGGGSFGVPWGINIDGADDVWTVNNIPLQGGAVYMAGDGTKGHPAGTKTGDVLHVFYDGTLQGLTDIEIDAAGNVWMANNQNDRVIATLGAGSDFVKSTWGGGWGITVLYGAAAPVRPPSRNGAVRGY